MIRKMFLLNKFILILVIIIINKTFQILLISPKQLKGFKFWIRCIFQSRHVKSSCRDFQFIIIIIIYYKFVYLPWIFFTVVLCILELLSCFSTFVWAHCFMYRWNSVSFQRSSSLRNFLLFPIFLETIPRLLGFFM